MKTTVTLCMFVLLSLVSKAQNFTLTFEDTSVINQVFYTDSIIDSLHVWQIGVPNKTIFNSAYSPPNAVVTELDTTMPVGVSSAFIIEVPNSFYGADGYIGSVLTFVHKYDFDSTKGGGYVEFSVDSGNHWHPVLMNGAQIFSDPPNYCISSFYGEQFIDGQYLFPPTWWSYVPMDTTPQGIPYFTGTDTTWIQDTIVMPAPLGDKTYQNILFLFRFTAFTNSNSIPKEGWMIDNIGFQTNVFQCPGGINEVNSSHIKVYPDPVADGFTVSLMDAGVHDYSISILDLTGRVLLYRDESTPEATLSRDGIAAGSYVIQVWDRETGTTMEKQVVFE